MVNRRRPTEAETVRTLQSPQLIAASATIWRMASGNARPPLVCASNPGWRPTLAEARLVLPWAMLCNRFAVFRLSRWLRTQ